MKYVEQCRHKVKDQWYSSGFSFKPWILLISHVNSVGNEQPYYHSTDTPQALRTPCLSQAHIAKLEMQPFVEAAALQAKMRRKEKGYQGNTH